MQIKSIKDSYRSGLIVSLSAVKLKQNGDRLSLGLFRLKFHLSIDRKVLKNDVTYLFVY